MREVPVIQIAISAQIDMGEERFHSMGTVAIVIGRPPQI